MGTVFTQVQLLDLFLADNLGDVQGGFVPDGEFVVAGRDGAVALDAVDAAFDCVALLVDVGVEGGRAAAR